MTNIRPLVKKSEFLKKTCVPAIIFCKSIGNGIFYSGQYNENFANDFLTRTIRQDWSKPYQEKHNCHIWGLYFLVFGYFVNNIGGNLRFNNF